MDPLAPVAHRQLVWVGQIEAELRGRGMAQHGFGLQAVQDDFLCRHRAGSWRQQPGRRGSIHRRRRSPPRRPRVAGGQFACGWFVAHDADDEHVAAVVATHADQLLR